MRKHTDPGQPSQPARRTAQDGSQGVSSDAATYVQNGQRGERTAPDATQGIPGVRRCAGCGQDFVATKSNQKYHSNECKRLYRAIKHSTKICKNPSCGKELPATKRKDALYCSTKCRKEAWKSKY